MTALQHRATFASGYANRGNPKQPRLMDCMLCIADRGHREFFAETRSNEFSVIDVLTKSKAWFEKPPGFDVSQVEAMIESHFGVRAFRADTRLWLV